MTDEELKGWLVTYEMLVAGDPDVFKSVESAAMNEYYERVQTFRKAGLHVAVIFPTVFLGPTQGYSARESDRLKAMAARLYCSGDNHE